jgi:hypothetical protein
MSNPFMPFDPLRLIILYSNGKGNAYVHRDGAGHGFSPSSPEARLGQTSI